MKFMTKEEYERKIFNGSVFRLGEHLGARINHKMERPKVSLLDIIKIKLGLKSERDIKVRVINDYVKDDINEWLEKPLYYEEKVDSPIPSKEEYIIVNKFDRMPVPVGDGYKFEKAHNESNKRTLSIKQQWFLQVWCDRLIRIFLFLGIFFLSQKVIMPVSNNWLIWTGTLLGTMFLSKFVKFIIVDSLKSDDFLFWNDIYVDKREWHYLIRSIIVFFFTFTYISHYIMIFGGFEYDKWIIGFILFIILNHIWFKYETDPCKKALK